MKSAYIKRLGAGLLGLSFFVSIPAAAEAFVAKLTEIQGNVMVNTGTTFEAATAGQQLQSGYKVVVPKGSSVKISYGDGCVVDVTQNTSYVVKPVGDCAVLATESGSAMPQGLALNTAAVGGMLVLGGIIVVFQNDDDDRDISPAGPP